jgi:uncharacterized protein (TIGR03083 family)
VSAADSFDYVKSIGIDSQKLLDLAAETDLAVPIPTCPGWTLRDLIEHVSGANRWVSRCVASGLTAQDRILPPGPTGDKELLEWTRSSVDELLAVLSATPPDELVWTPIRGPLGSIWWRRKAALELAVHRTDAENALGLRPETIAASLALDGIDEYAEEFLPLMLLGVAEPPVTAVLLSPTDSDESRTLSLIPAGDQRVPGSTQVELTGSAADLLLWMWNRVPDGTLTVSGDDAVVAWWKALAI